MEPSTDKPRAVYTCDVSLRLTGEARSLRRQRERRPDVLLFALAAGVKHQIFATCGGSTSDDLDGDGIPNLQEYLMGSPLFDPDDIDGDRIPDAVEDLHPGILSQLDFADAVADYDGDGVMNYEETLLGLDPASATTSGRTDGLSDAWEGSKHVGRCLNDYCIHTYLMFLATPPRSTTTP